MAYRDAPHLKKKIIFFFVFFSAYFWVEKEQKLVYFHGAVHYNLQESNTGAMLEMLAGGQPATD